MAERAIVLKTLDLVEELATVLEGILKQKNTQVFDLETLELLTSIFMDRKGGRIIASIQELGDALTVLVNEKRAEFAGFETTSSDPPRLKPRFRLIKK